MMERILTFGFGEPLWLLLLPLVPLLAWLRGRRGGSVSAVRYSAVSLLRELGAGTRAARGGWPLTLTLVALLLMILAMARPRIEQGDSPDKREGVDIVLCVDVSGSMDAKDFVWRGEKISRMDALIMAIENFVDSRPNDRFAMVGFAGHTYLLSPLTIDGEWIKNILNVIKTQFGTAIGEGIVTSLKVLEEAESSSRVIIVVTDGENNAGIDPLAAAEQAKKAGVRVHTIAIVRPAQVTVSAAVKSLLAKVADTTGGLHFQAASPESIVDVYRQIDKMEKSKFEQQQFRAYDELYPWFLLAAFGTLLLSLIGGHTWWMRLP